LHRGIGLQFKIWYALVPLACLSLLLALTGCDSTVGEVNDYAAPAEPQIRPLGGKNLVVPILTTLDRSVEEPSTAYSQAEDVTPADLVPIYSDYRIGKNDVVSVTIFDLMGEGTGEVPKVVRVSETGMISLPFIGPVKADGLTEHELEDAVAKAYEDANLIKKARVTVTVAEARARTFSVMGNVGASGEFELTRPDYRMLDAMVAAHGPTVSVGVDYCYVIRKLSSEKMPEPEENESPATPAPATQPTTPPGDLLAPPPGPQSHVDSPIPQRAMFMDQTTTPSNNNGLLAPGSDEGANGVIEGKPAPSPDQNNNTPATPAPAPAPQPETPAPVTPPEQPEQPAVPPAPTGESTGQFEFNAPKEPSDERVIRVPIWRLQHYGELKYNIVIRPGDMIVVPDPVTGVYYMGGHFLRSGVYSLTGIPVTIKEAWIAAGGGDDLAIPRRSEIIRQLGNDKEVFVRMDLTKIMGGEVPDIYLKPNDIVFVGTNIGAPFIAAVRNSFRLDYGFGFLYDRNFGSQSNDLGGF
jgi:polysaccharide export outer membrane protein